jgi:hypothetical protein
MANPTTEELLLTESLSAGNGRGGGMDMRKFRLVGVPFLGCLVGFGTAGIIIGSMGYGILFGGLLGFSLFVAQWRWIHGKRFGLFQGDRLEPTGGEEFDEAVRRLKEQGGLGEGKNDSQ